MTAKTLDTQPSAYEDLLPSGFMKKLEKLRLLARRQYPGASMGERMSRTQGSGLEFADYREYSPGDDFRNIDWKVYARLDELVIRTFETEENLPAFIMLDSSASMDFGGPPLTKWQMGCRLAAALGYTALTSRDALSVVLFSDRLHDQFDATRGRGLSRDLLEILSQAQPEGKSDFRNAFGTAGQQQSRPGLCFLISDFCTTQNLGDALKGLVFNGYEVVALHLVDQREANPGLEGEVDIEDAETGELIPMTVMGDTVELYREAFEASCRDVAKAIATYNGIYMRLYTDLSVEQMVLHRFRTEGLIG